MESLVRYENDSAMNTTDPTTLVYYVLKCVLDSYTLQEDTTCYFQTSTAGKLVVKCQYMIFMKATINLYWEENSSDKSFFFQHTQFYIPILTFL